MTTKKVKTAAILISRQSMYPSSLDGWVRQTVNAMKWIKENNYVLHSSIGMKTWDLITALASIYKVPIKITIPEHEYETADIEHKIIKEFELDPKIISFSRFKPKKEQKIDKQKSYLERDQKITESSDVLIPIAINSRGVMSTLMKTSHLKQKTLIEDFRISYSAKPKIPTYDFDRQIIAERTKEIEDKYIIHWTRTFSDCWPDENKLAYYKSLLSSDKYPRSAYDTLRKIVQTGTLHGTTKNMPHNIAAVSFSALAPFEIIELIKWRARYKQYTFEPYGIGLKKQTAQNYRIYPVIYYDKKIPTFISDSEQWLAQSIGTISDWRAEREHRHEGDFSLKQISKRDLVLVCYTQREAETLEKEFGIKAYSFTN